MRSKLKVVWRVLTTNCPSSPSAPYIQNMTPIQWGSPLTQFGLQSVVGLGSRQRGGVSAAVEPANSARAAVSAPLFFKGTRPRHGARAVHERHVVNGNAAVETRADRFEHQLAGGRKVREEDETTNRTCGTPFMTEARHCSVTLSLYCRYVVATLSLRCRYIVVTFSLHSRYNIAR